MTEPSRPGSAPGDGKSAELVSDLAGALTQLGGVLLAAETVDTAVQLVTRLAVETIQGSTGSGVTLVDKLGKRTTAASDPLVERVDALQYELDDGPCLTAWRDRKPVRVDDLLTEIRWPAWTAAAAPLGVVSVLSVPLVAGGEAVGAIKVYAGQPHVFDGRTETLLGLFAQQAAILIANTRTVADARRHTAQLNQALQTRDVISQAKAILLTRGATNDQAAFALLVTASRTSQLPVPEVAARLVASVTAGRIPDRPAPRFGGEA